MNKPAIHPAFKELYSLVDDEFRDELLNDCDNDTLLSLLQLVRSIREDGPLFEHLYSDEYDDDVLACLAERATYYLDSFIELPAKRICLEMAVDFLDILEEAYSVNPE